MPVIAVPGCPVPADTQVAVIRWALEGCPDGLGKHNAAPQARPCLATAERRGCGVPAQLGMRCIGCTHPKFPNFMPDRALVRFK